MTDPSAFQHPRFARMYERISRESELRGTAEHRDRALAELTGRVIEIGAGHGLNFRHYPNTVTEVLAVEPEHRLRALAEKAATEAPVPRVAGALAEIRRVLIPGGELRFFEHVRSGQPLLGLLQDVLAPVWSRAAGGCHPNRDTAAAIRAAGFRLEQSDRFCYAAARWKWRRSVFRVEEGFRRSRRRHSGFAIGGLSCYTAAGAGWKVPGGRYVRYGLVMSACSISSVEMVDITYRASIEPGPVSKRTLFREIAGHTGRPAPRVEEHSSG